MLHTALWLFCTVCGRFKLLGAALWLFCAAFDFQSFASVCTVVLLCRQTFQTAGYCFVVRRFRLLGTALSSDVSDCWVLLCRQTFQTAGCCFVVRRFRLLGTALSSDVSDCWVLLCRQTFQTAGYCFVVRRFRLLGTALCLLHVAIECPSGASGCLSVLRSVSTGQAFQALLATASCLFFVVCAVLVALW